MYISYTAAQHQYRDFVREARRAIDATCRIVASARSASSAARSSALPGPLLDLARAACAASGSLTTCSPSLTEWLASQSRGVPAMVDGIIESSAR